jgi:hypothetical protein
MRQLMIQFQLLPHQLPVLLHRQPCPDQAQVTGLDHSTVTEKITVKIADEALPTLLQDTIDNKYKCSPSST